MKKVNRLEIDASCRAVVLVWFVSALFWLLLGTLLALVVSWKMHNPYILANSPWLSFGRLRPAHLNSMIYGWGSMAGIGTLLWLQCRLARVCLPYRQVLYVMAYYWNGAVAYGIGSIVCGRQTGVEWLEMPFEVGIFLGLAFLVLMACSIKILSIRQTKYIYVSQWYLFGAVIWFPCLFVIIQALLYSQTPGMVRAVGNWWFAHNVLGLWMTPIGLATAYYLIPKILMRPIYSYQLSLLGFWTLALFYNWAGTHHLIGGPLPTWVVTAGIVGSVMMLVPVVTVALNHHLSMVGQFHRLVDDLTLRFTVFGAMSYTLVSVQGSLTALRSINQVTHFTHYTIAHAHLGVYAFYTMLMFAALYFIMPRLTLRDWPSRRLIVCHFWCCALGILVYFIALTIGGIVQGLALLRADSPFLELVKELMPYLQVRTLAGILIAVGHFAFIISCGWMLRQQERLQPQLPQP